jgi:predicted nucleic acid-binding protein
MRVLIDTNIFLEVILSQEKALEARSLLERAEDHEFFISDYSLHSIGLFLFRLGKHQYFRDFLEDMVTRAGTSLISLFVEDMPSVIQAARQYHLDFDDAYQYAVAAKNNLTLVSFDSHFDRTDQGRKVPAEINH